VHFDYRRIAKKMGILNPVVKKIGKEVKKEFPSDKMMYELNILRAVRSKYWQKGKGKMI